MARIRTIKPEFPQSESMGRVSRDARLLFIQLWTLCDDAGRSRGDARLIKGLLYPYDELKISQVDAWLEELEREGCLVRYEHEGSRYFSVCNWLNHQKIDRPSKSKIPEPDESSRILANPREPSSEDLRIKDQGSRTKEGTKDQGRSAKAIQMPTSFQPSESHADLAMQLGVNLQAEFASFVDFHGSKGNTFKDWDAALRTWLRNAKKFAPASRVAAEPVRTWRPTD